MILLKRTVYIVIHSMHRTIAVIYKAIQLLTSSLSTKKSVVDNYCVIFNIKYDNNIYNIVSITR